MNTDTDLVINCIPIPEGLTEDQFTTVIYDLLCDHNYVPIGVFTLEGELKREKYDKLRTS